MSGVQTSRQRTLRLTQGPDNEAAELRPHRRLCPARYPRDRAMAAVGRNVPYSFGSYPGINGCKAVIQR
jgi:hypothetical protein